MSKNSYSITAEMWWIDRNVALDDESHEDPQWQSPLLGLDVIRAIKAARAEREPMGRFKLQRQARHLFAVATGMEPVDEQGVREASNAYEQFASRFDFNDDGLRALEEELERQCTPPVQLSFPEFE